MPYIGGLESGRSMGGVPLLSLCFAGWNFSAGKTPVVPDGLLN